MGTEADAMGLLMGSGVPTAKFDRVNDAVEGEIVNVESAQQTDLESGAPLTWKDGRPKMQVIITLQTNDRDSQIEDDDGRRKLYAKFKLLQAVQAAMREGRHDPRMSMVGGWLRVVHTGTERPRVRGHNGAKLYSAQYRPPANPVPLDSSQVAPRGHDAPREAPRSSGGGYQDGPPPGHPAAESGFSDGGEGPRPGGPAGSQPAPEPVDF